MPAFEALLTKDEIEQVLDYVVFLSLRGETENGLVEEASVSDENDAEALSEDTVKEIASGVAGKWTSVWLTARALGLDRGTRRYLGLCFPSQGGAAMGLVLACAASPAVLALGAGGRAAVDMAENIVLLGVLLSQLFGPMVIDYAVSRGAPAPAPQAAGSKASATPLMQ